MSKRKNLVYSIISAVIGIGLLVAVVIWKNLIVGSTFFVSALAIFGGSIVAMFLISLTHELGHLFFGKINGFKFVSLTVWFFKWRKQGDNLRFSFVKFPEAAGVTEMIPKYADNIEKRFIKLTYGGIVFNFILFLIGLVVFFIPGVSKTLLCLLCPISPLSLYMILDNLLPTDKGGIRNDGGVNYGIKQKDIDSAVLINILKIQSELYLGKSYKDISKDLFFDVPQLPEDHPYFINLLTLRYSYYLDCGDYSNAISVLDRLSQLADYVSQTVYNQILCEELYAVCTYNFNENRADEIMYELEKYLNNNNDVSSVRAKLAYVMYILKEYDNFELFYNKGIREAKRLRIQGLTAFESSLLNKMKEDFDKNNE